MKTFLTPAFILGFWAATNAQINMQTSPNPAANTNNPTQLPVSIMDTVGNSTNATDGIGINPATANGTYMSDSLAAVVDKKERQSQIIVNQKPEVKAGKAVKKTGSPKKLK